MPNLITIAKLIFEMEFIMTVAAINQAIMPNAVANPANNSQMPGNIDSLADLASQYVDQVSSSYDFLNQVKQSAGIDSTASMLEIQQKIEDFTISTQLVSKVAASTLKDVDTLTRLQ